MDHQADRRISLRVAALGTNLLAGRDDGMSNPRRIAGASLNGKRVTMSLCYGILRSPTNNVGLSPDQPLRD